MQIGMFGLGRMVANMVSRLIRGGHECIVFNRTQERVKELAKELHLSGIFHVDVGTSGGVWGLERGYCLMIGGEAKAVRYLEPVFRTLAPGRGDISRTPGRETSSSTVEEGYCIAGHPAPATSST